jgi:ubiquinone/menaquinone biosynthesis C-methylase UbiE
MTNHFTDPTYLAYQYADSEKLRIRQEAHKRYSEAEGDFFDWLLHILDPQPGELVADVGCGPGAYHPKLAARGTRIVGIDASLGMAEDVRRQAQAQGLPVWALQANAEALPLADNGCDRLMANHMLYHVPDQSAALREMARVLKPGGRVILATNAADNSALLHQLHHESARELGYVPASRSMVERFSLDDLALVSRIFPNVRVVVRNDAFRFPTLDSVLRYYASMMIDLIEAPPADASHRAPLLASMTRKLEPIFHRDGICRVAKDAGCFVAEKGIGDWGSGIGDRADPSDPQSPVPDPQSPIPSPR